MLTAAHQCMGAPCGVKAAILAALVSGMTMLTMTDMQMSTPALIFSV